MDHRRDGVHGRRQRRAAADGRYAIPVCGGGKSGSGRERLVRPGDGHCGDADGAGGADRLDGAGDRIEGGGELGGAPTPTGSGGLNGYTLYRGDGSGCGNLSALSRTIAAAATTVDDTGVTGRVHVLLRAYCEQRAGRRGDAFGQRDGHRSDGRQAHRPDGHRSQRNFNQPELERPGGRWRRAIGRLQRVPLCGRRLRAG